METLISIINKKLLSLLNEKDRYDLYDEDLENLKLKLDNNYINISLLDKEVLLKNLINYKLDDEEINVLTSVASLPNNLRTVKSKIGILEIEDKVRKNIIYKIEQEQKFNKNKGKIDILKEIDNLNNLLKKIKNNEELITDIIYIKKLLNSSNIDIKEQCRVLMEINKKNEECFIKKDEKVTFVNFNLKETNISDKEFNKLLKKYSINFDIEDKDKQVYLLLKKYCDINKFDYILTFIENNNLNFVYENKEILSKILLYGSVKQIENIINVLGLDFVKKYQVVLYPRTKEFLNDEEIKSYNESGCSNYILENINLLKEKKFDINKIIEDIPTVLFYKTELLEKRISMLELYGINYSEHSNYKKCLSYLDKIDILDQVDKAIESNLFEYYKDNISKTLVYNPYIFKLCYSLNIKNDLLFKYSNGKYIINKEILNKKNISLDLSDDKIYELYSAYQLEFINKDIYDEVLNNNFNAKIIDLKNDAFISYLDSNYKINDYIYSFPKVDGVIISRIKVLRYYSTIVNNSNINLTNDLRRYIITKNSMLNQEEQLKISSCLKNIDFKELILNDK